MSRGRVVDKGFLGDLYSRYRVEEFEIMADKPGLLLRSIVEMGLAERAEIVGEKIRVKVRNYREFSKAVFRVSLEQGINIIYFKPVGGLKEVFADAVKRAG